MLLHRLELVTLWVWIIWFQPAVADGQILPRILASAGARKIYVYALNPILSVWVIQQRLQRRQALAVCFAQLSGLDKVE